MNTEEIDNHDVRIKFWGTRGSIPTPGRYFIKYGGNTPCVEIRCGKTILIFDAGTGLRELGGSLLHEFGASPNEYHILISHTHWDHIQGFPFFSPAFVSGNQLTFHSPFDDLQDRLVQQQDPTFFPVPLNYMSAALKFNRIRENEWHQIGPFRVYPLRLSHPGVAYGYRIEDGRSCLVMATDSEYKRVDRASTERYVEFFQDADLLSFDAQYSLTEVLDKLDWGHSTALMGAEFAHRANVKRLALFHHDPTSSDKKIWEAMEQAEAYLMHRQAQPDNQDIFVACDGMSLEL